MLTLIRNHTLPSLLCLLTALVLSACEKPTVDVSLHGVNYSAETFSYYVRDPAAPDKSGGGGELIDAFAAGGTTCCATLPRSWRPGIKVQVNTTHWLKKRPDEDLPEVKETYLVDVPPYVDGKPGELWVLRASNGGISVVSSDFQPDHPKWPGKVKGWPVPSLEYRRERWELIKKHEEGGVRDAISLLEQLERDPRGEAREAWEHAKRYQPLTIKGFSGPEDRMYVVHLRKEYEEALEYSRKRVKEVMEARP
jgi:hypothetical protein